MPSSTFASHELVNVGPLTTTFTAPPSCDTASNLAFAHASIDTFALAGYESCAPFSVQGDCVPSGSEIDAISKTRGRLLDDFGWAMPYYSPGYHCPSGYTTAGVVEMSADGKSSVTGIFSLTRFQSSHNTVLTKPYSLPGVNMVASALEEGETAVICCKR